MRARRRGSSRVSLVLSMSIVAGGCASLGGPPELQPIVREESSYSKTGAATLTNADLASTHAWSTPEAIRRLRPDFLRGSPRAPLSGPPEIAVYLNNSYAGDVSVLSSIPLDAIREVVFLHPTDARIRFGTLCDCAAGAIVVLTRRSD